MKHFSKIIQQMKISAVKTMLTCSHFKTFISQWQWIFQTWPQSTTNKKITIIIERKCWQFIQQSDFAQAINLNSLWFQMNSRYVIKYYKFTLWTWTKNCQLEINRNSRSEKEGTPQRINLLSLKNNQCQASILGIYPCTQGFGFNLVIWSEHKWNGLMNAVILQSNNF